jgi:hypothetical protein
VTVHIVVERCVLETLDVGALLEGSVLVAALAEQ